MRRRKLLALLGVTAAVSVVSAASLLAQPRSWPPAARFVVSSKYTPPGKPEPCSDFSDVADKVSVELVPETPTNARAVLADRVLSRFPSHIPNPVAA